MINCTFFAQIIGRCAQIRKNMQKNIVILASGSGTNTENIIRYFQSSDVARVVLVVSNKADAYVLERAKRLQVLWLFLVISFWKAVMYVPSCRNIMPI